MTKCGADRFFDFEWPKRMAGFFFVKILGCPWY